MVFVKRSTVLFQMGVVGSLSIVVNLRFSKYLSDYKHAILQGDPIIVCSTSYKHIEEIEETPKQINATGLKSGLEHTVCGSEPVRLGSRTYLDEGTTAY